MILGLTPIRSLGRLDGHAKRHAGTRGRFRSGMDSIPARSHQKEEIHATPTTQPILPDPSFPVLLWPGNDAEGAKTKANGRSQDRGSPSSSRIPGTPIQRRDAKADEPEDRPSTRQVRALWREIYGLQRRVSGPYQSARHGWRLEGRPPGQHP